jgi:hypothetical protein
LVKKSKDIFKNITYTFTDIYQNMTDIFQNIMDIFQFIMQGELRGGVGGEEQGVSGGHQVALHRTLAEQQDQCTAFCA